MTVDDRGEGGCLAYLVSPDDVISGQPLTANFGSEWEDVKTIVTDGP